MREMFRASLLEAVAVNTYICTMIRNRFIFVGLIVSV